VVVHENKNEYVKIRTHDIVVGPGSHGSEEAKFSVSRFGLLNFTVLTTQNFVGP
jgi:hypothetical protein